MWFCVFICGELHDLFTIFVTIQMNAKAEEAEKNSYVKFAGSKRREKSKREKNVHLNTWNGFFARWRWR